MKQIAVIAPDFQSAVIWLRQTQTINIVIKSVNLIISNDDGIEFRVISSLNDIKGRLFDSYMIHPAYNDRLIQEVKLRLK